MPLSLAFFVAYSSLKPAKRYPMLLNKAKKMFLKHCFFLEKYDIIYRSSFLAYLILLFNILVQVYNYIIRRAIMKKISLVLAVFSALVLTLSACAGVSFLSPDDLDLDKAYNFSANMSFGSFDASAQFERQSASVWNVTFSEPYALAGMEIVYRSGEVTSRFEGVEFTAPGNSDAVVAQIIDAFEDAIGGEGCEVTRGQKGSEEIRVTSKAGGKGSAYELVLNERDNRPLSLVIAESSLSVNFADVRVAQIVQVIVPSESE